MLNEDRTFQNGLKIAIADEVASKETLELQNNAKSGEESVYVMRENKGPEKFPNIRNPSNFNKQKPPLPLGPKSPYTCYSCGNTEFLEPSVDLETSCEAVSLKFFLGLILYHSCFTPHHSTVLASLNTFLKKIGLKQLPLKSATQLERTSIFL